MLKKFLEEAINLTVGRNSEEITKLLHSKKHVNEFLLAKKLDLTINQTRNILYKISDHGLLSSIRKKDKKKGWYTYFWKIEVLKALEFVRAHLLKEKSILEEKIEKRETQRFYFCKRCNIEMTEEDALTQNFICEECGSILELRDNKKILKDMRKELGKINKDLEMVDEEIQKEAERLEKKKERQYKREQRAKKRKRAARRAKRKKEREKKKAKAKKTAKKKSSGRRSAKKSRKKKPKKKKTTRRKTKKTKPAKKTKKKSKSKKSRSKKKKPVKKKSRKKKRKSSKKSSKK